MTKAANPQAPKTAVHVEYDAETMLAEAHCHLCTWTDQGPIIDEPFGHKFYERVREHAISHAGEKPTTGRRPPRKQYQP